jgi:IS30 family transposase
MSRRTSSASVAFQDPTPTIGLEGQILRVAEIARIMRRGVSTVLREIRAGTFRPEPFRSHPYSWYRADVAEYFAKRPKLSRRKAS